MAFVALFEAEQAQLDAPDVAAMPAKARRIVAGVLEHAADIDARIGEASHNWSLGRMPAVDRSLLRVGAYELLYTVTPMAVVISEIVELAKRYSTERSGSFVNGVLAAVAESADR